MRTQEEIVERVRVTKSRDMFGFEWHEYIMALDFEHASEFLKPDSEMTAEQWDEGRESVTPEVARQKIRDYMGFAWGKANNRRGISACRSIQHCIAWTWLAGDESLAGDLELDLYVEDGYSHYGKPQLVKICRFYGIDWPALDDDRWTNYEHGVGEPADVVLERLGMAGEES